ncbi:hypothetical protein H257_06735 [Aphanomyces astaci]|uniref:Uncharacterized protein n=1 Tax=Aphanomyces astaci TaxID=112090 RepID=W4GN63_APHAT|nr:hypothetical protein H257_06735 [Aphanomyces astaci]ETV80464.1 hypothetical protein H257_06735 [Aphanomyces astaci]|eukprot:XP_009830388.1 hypothetical protein H257_06735 [Aphanomyces astaci]
MFDWASRKSVSVVTKEQEVSPTSAGDWFNFCREVCSAEMLTCEMKLFGGVDRMTKKWFGILTFDARTKIMSDKFGSYVSSNERHTLETNPRLRGMNYTHAWVNHSENFVNPINGSHSPSKVCGR